MTWRNDLRESEPSAHEPCRLTAAHAGRSGGSRAIVAALLSVLVAAITASCATTLSAQELAAEYLAIGTGYLELGEFGKSSEYLGRALSLDPALEAASYNLARVLAIQGRYEEAESRLLALLDLDPKNVLVLSTLAYVQYASGSSEDAAASYDAALEIDPGSVDLLYNRALLYRHGGDLERAEELLLSAQQLKPEDPQLAAELAEIYRELELPEQAVEQLALRAELEPDEIDTQLELASAYNELTDFSAALEIYSQIEQRTELDEAIRAEASFKRAVILLTAAEEPEAGLLALATAIELGYRDPDAVRALLDDPDLLRRLDVRGLLNDSDLLPPESPAESDDDSADPDLSEELSPDSAPGASEDGE